MQNIAVLLHVDFTDVAVCVGLVLAASARQMYRPADGTELMALQ
jgi:hypothetical protein